MPVKLIPHLRLLSSSLPISQFPVMKFNPPLKHSRAAIPVFSRIFPLKLKYQALSRKPSLLSVSTADEQPPVRRFSTRAASKSLIDDEAELSDWVSGLKSDSFRTSLYSDDDRKDSDSGRFRSGGDGGRGRGRGRGRGGMDRVFSEKRRRENDSDDDVPNRSSRARDSMDSFPRNSRVKGEFGKEENGFQRGSSFSNEKRGGRGSELGYERGMDRNRRGAGGGRGGGTRGGPGRGRGGSELGYGRDRPVGGGRGGMEQDRREVGGGRGGRGGRGGPGRGRGGSELGYGRDRPVGGGRGGLNRDGKSLGKRSLITSSDEDEDDDDDSEEVEDLKDSFRGLITEEDSDEEEDSDDEDEEDGDDEEDRDDDVMIKNTASLSRPANKESKASSSGSNESYLSETRFDQCSVSPLSLKGIKDAGYEKMTMVQEATLPIILKGKDVLAKAKTGTGKTVAFLLPSIEVVVNSAAVSRDQKRPPIIVLVICPTRELANQAAAEANKLLKYHPSIGVQVVIGGTRLALEQKRMQANPCQILVATPGRLRDHMENTAGFATRLTGVKVLVLDEADHLLDMGFRKDIERIIAAVPKQRQTLLFSATVPEEVRQICHIALKRDHEFISTVEEGTEETHAQVKQMHLVAPLDKHFNLLYVLLKEHIADDVDYKVLVFCTTAMVTKLMAAVLGELNMNVREIHSRKPQSYRTRISDEFRKSKGLILVTSDVSARGVDYPDVSLVIQVGLPSDRQQYIHRLGRTGRKGKEGQGILLLTPWEEFFLSSIKDLPLSKAPIPTVDPDTKKKVERALSQVDMKSKESAYQAWLGYYNSNKTVSRDKCRLVELANEFSRSMGLANPPAIPKLVLGKMGLKNVPGLRSK